ncbi:hypothetical protein JX265_010072 [Neoarthrinium moseri]|uniref:SprT-like domain-containing protein n=1 Tax=Neoarthrinium moseri TaxID=1658444 RepID=A0A9P9WF26_9PEZI|nr:hypothetical protein JX265_010072 [Neoarthrinium moseri]
MYPRERIMQDLKARADQYPVVVPWRGSFWRVTLSGYRYTGEVLIKASAKYSKSAEGKENKTVGRFLRHYKRDSALDLEDIDLQELMEHYMDLFDHIFFFGILTRVGPRGQIVMLKVLHKSHPKHVGQFYQNSGGGVIELNTMQREAISKKRYSEKMHTFDELLSTLVHELLHAYLEIFSHPNCVPESHGWEFVKHLKTMMKRMSSWIPDSDEFRQEAIKPHVSSD